MNKRIAVSVFLATVSYQFLDAGAELFLPYYDRTGVIAAVLFWVIPAGTAFILGYRTGKKHTMDCQRDKRVYRSTVLGAGVGQFISLVVLFPTPALPDMTLVGSIIIAGFTALLILITTFAGIYIGRPLSSEKTMSYRFCVISAGLFFLIAISEMYMSNPSYLMAVGEVFAGVWLLFVARKIKLNGGNKNNEEMPSTA